MLLRRVWPRRRLDAGELTLFDPVWAQVDPPESMTGGAGLLISLGLVLTNFN